MINTFMKIPKIFDVKTFKIRRLAYNLLLGNICSINCSNIGPRVPEALFCSIRFSLLLFTLKNALNFSSLYFYLIPKLCYLKHKEVATAENSKVSSFTPS